MMDDKILQINGFEIVEDKFDQDKNKYYEGIFTQGNGYFHVRGSFEEGLEDAPQNEVYTRTMKSVTTEMQRHPLSKQGTFLPLIMGKHPFLEEVIINLPYFMRIEIMAGDEKLDMIRSDIRDYRRILNMKTGEVKRTFTWTTFAGEEVGVEFSRFASLDEKRLFVQQVKLESIKGKPYITVKSGIDSGVTKNGYCHFTECGLFDEDNKIGVTAETDVGESVSIMCENRLNGLDMVRRTEMDGDIIDVIYEGTLNENATLVKYSVLGCSRDLVEDYVKEMQECLERTVESEYKELLEKNKIVWEQRWNDADVLVEGCQKLQDSLRFSIYHLLRCSGKEEERIQICAKGFAGEAYYGRYFWDSEMYLLPFYLYTDPLSAKSLIGYRYWTLEGAKQNAQRYHCRGARYPWQSALTGIEQCSMWEYADNEVHITADVAFGVMHYYLASGDEKFLFDKGVEILLETSKFWSDRVDKGEDGKYHLLNVMGPDEYSPMTRDNGFTNYMVKFNLISALETLHLLKAKKPDRYVEVMEKTNTSENELELFGEIADSLIVPYDPERKLYLQSADFEDYALIDMDSIWKDKKRAFGHYASQEKIYRSRCIKQADTIALMSIFSKKFTDEQMKTAYEYYKPLTTHDSSLSPAVHMLVANRLGMEEETEQFLERTMAVDMELARRGAEDGIHIANCGALWQMAVQGFMGMLPAYQDEILKFEPHMPSFIKSMETTIMWKGKKYKVRVQGEKVSVREMPVKKRGFLFDLDGVLTDTAEYHFLAWKKLADELGLLFDRTVNERLKGVSRERSFEIILEVNGAQEKFSTEEKEVLIDRKNKYYKELIKKVTSKDILPGIVNFLNEAKKQGILLAVASASKNARTVLEGLGIMSMFDYVADASKIRYTKPNPEVFLDCMEYLKLQPWECIAFEDAAAGIEAIQAAKITAVGIGMSVDPTVPDIFLKNTEELSIKKIEELLYK